MMNIKNTLKRTNKTDLLDEELIILDALFDESDTFEALEKENYADWHNLPYSHHLDTETLKSLIEKLIHIGYLKSYTSRDSNKLFYALTETGGKLWEAERAPDWERYCIDGSMPNENDRWELSVASPSITTATAFLDCANHCRLYKFNPDEIKTTTSTQEKLSTIYWRTFPAVYSLSVPTYELPEINIIDWDDYENKRVWWRSLTELARFQIL